MYLCHTFQSMEYQSLVPTHFKDYTIKEEIGSGAFGHVLKVEKDGKVYALKVKKRYAATLPFCRETVGLHRLKGTNSCVKFIDRAYEIEGDDLKMHNNYRERLCIKGLFDRIEEANINTVVKFGILMEYLEDYKPVVFHDYFKEKNHDIYEQIVKAIEEVNNAGYSHGDIRAENIMYNQKLQKVVLIDFGNCSETKEPRDLESLEDTIKFWFM